MAGNLMRYIKKSQPDFYKKLKPQGQEPTTKSASLKMKAPGNKDAMAPKGGYKSRKA